MTLESWRDLGADAWEQWAYLRDPEGLVPYRSFHSYVRYYWPRKVPHCPACEAGVPRRTTDG